MAGLDSFAVYLLAATIAAYLGLGLLVVYNNPRAVANLVMLSFTVIAALWAFSVLMINVQHDSYRQVLFWIRLSHGAAILLPWHVFTLATTLFRDRPFSSRSVPALLFLSLAFAVIAMTPFFISGIAEPFEERVLELGYFATIYYLFYTGAFGYVIWLLRRKMSSSRGLTRVQIYYFAWGIIVTILLSSLANIILPLAGIIYIAGVDVRNLGPTFSLILIGSISCAIVKHHLMDVRFAFRRNIASLAAAALLVVFLAGVFRFLPFRPDWPANGGQEAAIALVAVVVLVLFPPLKRRIQLFLDSRFFKKVTDYHSSLLRQVQELTTVLDLEELLRTLTRGIVRDMDLDHGYYCYRVNADTLLSEWYGGFPRSAAPSGEPCWPSPPLLTYLEQKKDVLLQSDLKKIKPGFFRETLERELTQNGAEVVVPLFTKNRIDGFLCLGEKYSGEPFFSEDVRLFSILASQISAALKNARLYCDLLSVKSYMQNIVANMGNGLVAVNSDGEITLFNGEAEAITGISVGKALGGKVLPVLGSGLNELYQQALKDGRPMIEEEVRLRTGSEQKYVKCNVSRLWLPESERSEVIMVLSDVTRLRELEKERSRDQRLASLGEMAAGIAHEIKNPLVAIKTFADLLPEKYEESDFRRDFSGLVSREVTRINDLVTELLSFVRETDLLLEEVDLAVLLDEVVMLISFQAERQGIALEKQYTRELAPVWADHNLIRQALINVCVNALQAMPGGGVLRIGVVSPTAGKKVLPGSDYHSGSGRDRTGGVEIFVEDSGGGVPEAIRDQLFDPFVTGKSEGTGIGLSISHKIVTAHGGQIRFADRPGGGTVFNISLPRKE